jgi:WhiB family redox-sensing transcriptional regulator
MRPLGRCFVEEESPVSLAEPAGIADWQEEALCRGYDNIVFFGDEGESELEKQGREARAKAICKTCPVADPCLEFAMETNQKYGIWGGLTAKERASLKRRRARARRAS